MQALQFFCRKQRGKHGDHEADENNRTLVNLEWRLIKPPDWEWLQGWQHEGRTKTGSTTAPEERAEHETKNTNGMAP